MIVRFAKEIAETKHAIAKMELPRIESMRFAEQPGREEEMLNELLAAIDVLAAGMPARLDTGSLFEVSLLPPRFLAARDSQRYRMVEICRAACACVQHDQGVAGSILTRAAYETASVIFYLDNAVIKAWNQNALGNLDDTLLRVVVGSKIAYKPDVDGSRETPAIDAVNVLTMIDRLKRHYTGLGDEYAILCEIAHPNQLGAYAKHDKNLNVIFEIKQPYTKSCCCCLTMAILLFGLHYNHLADVFPAFVELCKRDAPRKSIESQT